MGAPYGVVDLILCSFYYEGEQGYLDPNTASVWEFSEDGLTVTLTNGVFIGFAANGGYYNWDGSVHDTGTVGNRQKAFNSVYKNGVASTADGPIIF